MIPFKQYQKYILIIVPILLIGTIIYFLSDIFTYLVLGWILSLLGAPIFRLFNRFLSRNLSAAFTLISITIIFSIGMWLIIPPIVQQTRNLTTIDYESIMRSLDEPMEDWNNWLINKGLIADHTLEKDTTINKSEENSFPYEVVKIDTSHGANINIFIDLKHKSENGNLEDDIGQNSGGTIFDSIKENIFNFFNPRLVTSLFSTIAGFFGNLLITILSAFFIAFFFLKEKGLFTKIIKSLIPNEKEEQAAHAIEDSENLLVRYFVGIALQVSVITAFMSISLRIFGFENALLIAFMAGLINLIPYIGPILGAMFGIVITVSSNVDMPFYGEILPDLLKLVSIFAVMQLMDNFLLQPNIFSKSVKAHPLEIFIIVLLGAKVGGILGMIIAIPTYTIFRVIAKVFLSEFKIVQSLTRGM